VVLMEVPKTEGGKKKKSNFLDWILGND